MVETGANNRKSARAAIELKVEYQKLNGFFSDYTKNISKGGTFIKTLKPLPIGTEFVFKLFVPFSEEPFELRGEVAWINTEAHKEHPERDEAGMGISFIYEQASEREAFESVVERLMKDSLGARLYEKLLAQDAES